MTLTSLAVTLAFICGNISSHAVKSVKNSLKQRNGIVMKYLAQTSNSNPVEKKIEKKDSSLSRRSILLHYNNIAAKIL